MMELVLRAPPPDGYVRFYVWTEGAARDPEGVGATAATVEIRCSDTSGAYFYSLVEQLRDCFAEQWGFASDDVFVLAERELLEKADSGPIFTLLVPLMKQQGARS